jgi:endonuclease/exonuclease/phosphatase family metal-dependent hydrolase
MKFSLLIMLLLSFPGWAKWSVTTYNIRNFDKDPLAGKTDIVELRKVIKDVKSDVMVFEEIVNAEAFEVFMKKELPDYEFEISDCGGGGRQLLVVAYNLKTFEFVRTLEDLTFSGSTTGCGSLRSVLLVTLKHKETKKDYTFGAVHLKAGGDSRSFKKRWEQYKKLESLAKEYTKENLILLGDFNTTGYNIKDADFVKFEDFMNRSGLRTMSETLGCSSYWTGTLGGPEFQSSLLDHIVIQDKILSSVESARVTSHCAAMDCRPVLPENLGRSFSGVSDHCPIQVTFK